MPQPSSSLSFSDPSIGDEIRRLRLSRGLGLAALAVRAGVGRSTLGEWETGRHTPTGSALERTLDALEALPRERARLLSLADPAYARIVLFEGPFGAPIAMGAVLRAMRLRRSMTQTDLARAVGVAQGTVAKWESGDLTLEGQTLQTVLFALEAEPVEVVALTAARPTAGEESFDFEKAWIDLHHLPHDLWKIGLLGLEADLWRRALCDSAWSEPLVRIASYRVYNHILDRQFDEIPQEARRVLVLARSLGERIAAAPAFFALGAFRRRQGLAPEAYVQRLDKWMDGLPDSEQRFWALSLRAQTLAEGGYEAEAFRALRSNLEVMSRHQAVTEADTRRALAEVHLVAKNGGAALSLLEDDEDPGVQYSRARALLAVNKEPSKAIVETLRQQAIRSRVPLDREKLEVIEMGIARLRKKVK
ncbi:transcriptional regulator [bacterium]|nr:MAG: transcriptional regulator [bacterium]